MIQIHYRKVNVDGFKVLHREDGRAGAPTLPLLSRISECRPYVSRADPGPIGSLRIVAPLSEVIERFTSTASIDPQPSSRRS